MIKLLLVLCMTAIVASAGFLSPAQRRYLAGSSKVLSAGLSGTNLVYVLREDGRTVVRTQSVLRVVGFARPDRFSRRKIVGELKAAGKWSLVNDWLTASGWQDEWLVSTYLAADDPLFIAATNAVVSAQVLTSSELQSILSRSAWSD